MGHPVLGKMAYVAISRVRLRKRLFQIHPEKKNISNPAPVLFLVKNLVSQKQKSENNEQKIVVFRVLVLLKKFYHARRKNGKCKSVNQSISQLVACREKDAIYSVFGSHW